MEAAVAAVNESSHARTGPGWLEERLDLAYLVLLGAAIVELTVYRLAANLGIFTGVGADGLLARMADFGLFSMVLTGALAAALLVLSMLRIIHDPSIDGGWWRAALIVISPVYLITTVWSIWMELTGWILLFSVASAGVTMLLLVLVVSLRAIPHSYRRLIGATALMIALAIFAWVVLDFLEYSRLTRLGQFAFNAYQFAEGIAVLVPAFAYFVLVFDSASEVRRVFSRPHIPALALAVVTTGVAVALVLQVQAAGEVSGLIPTSQYFVRVAYRTLGFTLHWPFGIPAGMVSLFFLVLTVASLVVPFGSWTTTAARRDMGIGLGLIYVAGLQPISVYQYAMTLLGFVLLTTGVAARFPASGNQAPRLPQNNNNHLEEESDGEHGQGGNRTPD